MSGRSVFSVLFLVYGLFFLAMMFGGDVEAEEAICVLPETGRFAFSDNGAQFLITRCDGTEATWSAAPSLPTERLEVKGSEGTGIGFSREDEYGI